MLGERILGVGGVCVYALQSRDLMFVSPRFRKPDLGTGLCLLGMLGEIKLKRAQELNLEHVSKLGKCKRETSDIINGLTSMES